MTNYDPTVLPADLPVPEEDGAADHLAGMLASPMAAAYTAPDADR